MYIHTERNLNLLIQNYQFKMLKDNKGFNLIEVLALMAIIAIMFAVAVQFIPTLVKKEAVEETKEELNNLRLALLEYYKDTDVFPSQLRDLETDPGVSGWDGPYIRPKFEQYDYEKDEWDEDYEYSYTVGTWGTDPCSLYSKGPNKKDDGGSEDDIPVNPEASRDPERLQVNPAQIKKEIERLVKNELRIIQQKGEDYEIEQGSFPFGIDDLYTTISPAAGVYYLKDESYRKDRWERDYLSDGSTTFYSEGQSDTTSNDDIYP